MVSDTPEHTGGGDSGSNVDRRDMIKAAGFSAVTAALAGCSELLGGGAQTGDGGGGGGDVPDEPIQAALQTFTEGPASVFGVEIVAGTEMAVEDINANGGVAGREVELEVVHEAGSQVENYQSFVEQGKDVTLGPTSSGGHRSMAPVIEDEGVINMGNDGTTTALYEETLTDPTYSFRFQNYNTTEVIAAALTAVEELGADNIDTVAGINPDYEFGQNEMDLFTTAIQQLTDAEVVYSGFPELGASDVSTHITSVKDAEPDIVFSSLWGGDSSLLLRQANANDMFEDTGALVGTVIGTDKANLNADMLADKTILAGERNYVWNFPDPGVWPVGQEFAQRAEEKLGYLPSYPVMSGYGSMFTWAVAAQQAVDMLGSWPTQEQLARAIEHQGIYTPGGFYQMSKYGGHQGIGNAHYGRLAWNDGIGFPVLTDVRKFSPTEIVPPEGMTTPEWVEGWEL